MLLGSITFLFVWVSKIVLYVAWSCRLHESREPSSTFAFSCLCVNCHRPLAVVPAELHITNLHTCLSLEEAFSRTSSQNVHPLELPSRPLLPWAEKHSYIISWWYLEIAGQRTCKEKGSPKECCVDFWAPGSAAVISVPQFFPSKPITHAFVFLAACAHVLATSVCGCLP